MTNSNSIIGSSSSNTSSNLVVVTTTTTTHSATGGVTYYANAHRQRGGICIGTIWCCIITSKNNHVNNSKQQQRSSMNQLFTNSFSNFIFRGGNTAVVDPCNIRNAIPMYCILMGSHVLYAYESETEYVRGDTPIHIWTIVGASVWFPHARKKTTTATASTTASAAAAAAALAVVLAVAVVVFLRAWGNQTDAPTMVHTYMDH